MGGMNIRDIWISLYSPSLSDGRQTAPLSKKDNSRGWANMILDQTLEFFSSRDVKELALDHQ